jgi:hypothetical protein
MIYVICFFKGCRARDDDKPDGYGRRIYIYNDVYIEIIFPTQSNEYLGSCVYTGLVSNVIQFCFYKIYRCVSHFYRHKGTSVSTIVPIEHDCFFYWL